MKREIKFRAIIPVNSNEPKRMVYFDLSKLDDIKMMVESDYSANQLMQFTGLLDKNGKEIYEGDIYKASEVNLPTYQVLYKNGAFCGGINMENCEPLAWEFKVGFGMKEDEWVQTFLEVIGNIYETPELLQT